MLTLSRPSSRKIRARRSRLRRPAPLVDACEERVLLATGFLQGTVTVGNGQGLPGATIVLHRLDASVADQTTTTDASGKYLFTGLAAGSYRLTETPPAGYVNDSTQAASPLTPVIATTSSSIDVQIGDEAGLSVSYPSHNKETLTVTTNGTTRQSLIGQLNIGVTQADINSTSPLFASFCVDFFRDVFTGEQNLPYTMTPLSTALASISTVKNPQNAGQIAYLFNHIASTWGTTSSGYVPAQEAAGFQLAIWELEYETSGTYNVLDGSFYVHDLTASSPEVTYAQGFINLAQGKSEEAVFLDGQPTSSRPGGSQGLIAPMTLNFINAAAPPAPGISIQKFTNGVHDTDPNGSNLVIASPVAALTWTYDVTNTGNVGFARSDVVVTDSVEGVNPAYASGDANGNNILDPGETWVYSATGAALDLTGTLPPTVKVVPGGDPNGTGNTRNVYENTGTVTITGTSLTASDISHYANPAAPGVTIQKFTNGVHDTNPNGNDLVLADPGMALTWTYNVSNTGNVSFASANVAVSDSVSGLNPAYTSGDSNNNGLLDPGETWVYSATGAALDLTGTLPPTVKVVPGGDPNGTGNTRNVYENTGTVAIVGTSLTASDISHYANFPSAPPGPTVITLAGTVFHECNNNGVYEPSLGETGLANVVVILSGTDNTGQAVSLTTTTDAAGKYAFDLTGHPGVYTVTMTVPSGYIDGKSTPGTAGGTAGTTTISSIDLTSPATGYNFAVLLPSSLSGLVYYDLNHDGAMGATDFGIAHVVVTLTGTDDRGHAVSQQVSTGDDGTFSFNGLRPGTYEITRTQPGLFRRYQNTAGTLGGTVTPDAFKDINVPGCSSGTGYLFGELQQPTCRLRSLAIHVGNTFARQKAEYAANPTAFAQARPNLVSSIAAGQVPWGKGTYPRAPLARHWVPTLGTKPITLRAIYDRTATAAARVTAKAAAGASAARTAVVTRASGALRAVRSSAQVKAALAQVSRVHAAIRRG